MNGLRRNESQIGVTKVGIIKKSCCLPTTGIFMTIHINMKKLRSYFFLFFHISFCAFTDHDIAEA